MSKHAIRIGVDIGGTFTDVVLERKDQSWSTKVLTTYSAPEDAILTGIEKVCARSDTPLEEIDQIIHGTTLATNALIERRGAGTALITTEGFRDVIEMRTESRFEQYDLNLTLPEPLLPRQRRYTLRERIGAQGQVLIAPDTEEITRLAGQLRAGGYESLAIGFLHSYLNPSHEQQVARALRAALPGVMISLSSEVSPQMREYERFNTVIANAYIKPLMKSYLSRLRERLQARGIGCEIYMMHSGGGLMSLESAAEFPVRLVESGPAGGAVFAAHIAARHGLKKVVSFDMGGTTAKICLIRDASPQTSRVFEVARSYRFKKGSGMPISIPVIDMVEIGAGGGSLASVDALRQIRVGPESASSEPGPACYGRGGTRPAVTDADLVLGKLDPDQFAAGTIPLTPAAAHEALTTHVGDTLALDAGEAAHGIAEVVDENMANAARVHAVENGEDLSEYTMIAFGGAAPLHAGRLCEKLGIGRCLVPEGAGVGSAIGFLRAPFSFEATRSHFMTLSDFDSSAAAELFAQLEEEAVGFVRRCDEGARVGCAFRVFMRYAGQGWEIPVSLSPQEARAPDAGTLGALFAQTYAALFGRVVEGMAPEITVWSAHAASHVPAPAPLPQHPAPTPVQAQSSRRLFDPGSAVWHDAPAFARQHLPPGAALPGPSVITEAETTIIVPASREAHCLSDGCIDITTPEQGNLPQ